MTAKNQVYADKGVRLMDDLGQAAGPNSKSNEEAAQQRRERLARISAGRKRPSRAYSNFVRTMRVALPLSALAIIVVIFSWPNMHEDTVPDTAGRTRPPATIGKNELVNPQFESKDEKNQPYTITAKRAVQGESNEELIILEKPVADMVLNSGNWIAIEANQGAYRQDMNRLLLQGSVKLFHDRGYQLETEKLHIDLTRNFAWSEEEVYAQGPEGTLHATGLKASSETGQVIFTGPAKLTLNEPLQGIN